MSWATSAIEQLKKGTSVTIKPRGNSMKGKIESGSLVRIDPVTHQTEIKVNDIVLCKVHGIEYLHLIKAIRPNGSYLIGNNKGRINGWIQRRNIFGIFAGFVPE